MCRPVSRERKSKLVEMKISYVPFGYGPKRIMEVLYPHVVDNTEPILLNGSDSKKYVKIKSCYSNNVIDSNRFVLYGLEYNYIMQKSYLVTIEEAQELINTVCEDYDVEPIKIVVGCETCVYGDNDLSYDLYKWTHIDHKSTIGYYSNYYRTIYIVNPEKMLRSVILHEITHSFFERYTVQDHGPEYCDRYFELLERYHGYNKIELEHFARNYNVLLLDKRTADPVSYTETLKIFGHPVREIKWQTD